MHGRDLMYYKLMKFINEQHINTNFIFYTDFIMSKYDQRMLKPRSNLLYLQLIPTVLTKLGNSSQNNSQIQNLSFKLYKGNQLIDHTKMPVPIVQLNGYYSISRVFINFNVSLAQNTKFTQFVLKIGQVCGKNSIIDMIYDQKSYDAHFGEESIGQYVIKVDHYVDQFTNNDVKYFKESVQISEKFALALDLYVEKTRFMLQKYVRNMRETAKQNSEINVGKIKKSEINQNHHSSPQSQKSERVYSRGYENIFISPFRSLEKNRKLIVRNSIKKNNTTIIQEDSAVYSKSLNKNESGEKKLKFLKPESKIKNASSQAQDDPLKDFQQSNYPGHNEDNFDRPSYGSTEELEIKMVKSEASSKRTKKLSKNGLKPKKTQQDCMKQAKQDSESALRSYQKKDANKDISFRIFSIVFVVFAFIIMLKVMSPSRKV